METYTINYICAACDNTHTVTMTGDAARAACLVFIAQIIEDNTNHLVVTCGDVDVTTEVMLDTAAAVIAGYIH